jgi:methylmalonyl-CoA mutase
VFLANLGPVASHTARATWAKNFFESGGIEALGNDGFADADAAAAAFTASGAWLACICGSDAAYAESAEAVAKALTAAGARRVYLAGNPGDARTTYESAGVDEFVRVGVDVVAALDAALTTIEETAR